jgi:hypothetical protein
MKSKMICTHRQDSYSQSGADDLAAYEALQLYRKARIRAWLGKVWSVLTGHSRRLFQLELVRATCAVRGSHYAGTQSVPIRQILGSEGRYDDFDTDFRPLQARTKKRWLSIALARYKGMILPMVELIQVGDIYFVRDGHHRISVARALGQTYVDAKVIVWEVNGLFSFSPNWTQLFAGPNSNQKWTLSEISKTD